MTDIEVVTKSHGYKAMIRPFLTYDQFIEIQKLYTQGVVIDMDKKDAENKPAKPEMGKVNASVMYDANKLAVKFLIVSIVDSDGKTVNRASDELPVPADDGAEIMDKVNEITKDAGAAFDKKKVTS